MADKDVQAYRAIFEKYRPPGIKVRWKRGKALAPAEANLRKASMLVPRLVSIEALGYALHECAHYTLRHFSPDETDNPTYRHLYTSPVKRTLAEQEFEAERWSMAVLRVEGLHVSRKLLGLAKTYVAECVDSDTLSQKSRPHVKKWCQR